AAGRCGRGADAVVGGAVSVVITVAEVESRYVHAGFHHGSEAFRARRGRAEGRDYLCSTCHATHSRAFAPWNGLVQVASRRHWVGWPAKSSTMALLKAGR